MDRLRPIPTPTLPEPELAFAASRPRPHVPVVQASLVAAAAVIAGIAFTDMPDAADRAVAWGTGLVLAAGVVGVSLAWAYLAGMRLREESLTVQRAEDAARLGRTEISAVMLGGLLSGAMVSPVNRGRALTAYVAALAKSDRFEEAVGAADALMAEGVPLDVELRLRASKVYCLLREDRLADADRSIGDVRKMGRDGPPGAVLALVETYREVRTRHLHDLLDAFAVRRDLVAKFMGRRAGDIDALVAWALLSAGNQPAAQTAWRRATLLVPAPELVSRYPELRDVSAALAPTPVPPEVR
jgi:hypothetical protein